MPGYKRCDQLAPITEKMIAGISSSFLDGFVNSPRKDDCINKSSFTVSLIIPPSPQGPFLNYHLNLA